jgi:hypothetical protein
VGPADVIRMNANKVALAITAARSWQTTTR